MIAASSLSSIFSLETRGAATAGVRCSCACVIENCLSLPAQLGARRSAATKGYAAPIWMTFRQALVVGAHVLLLQARAAQPDPSAHRAARAVFCRDLRQHPPPRQLRLLLLKHGCHN